MAKRVSLVSCQGDSGERFVVNRNNIIWIAYMFVEAMMIAAGCAKKRVNSDHR